MPSTAVYFAALPSRIALMAAALMLSGVSKSGSPAPSPMTSRPAAFRARALSVTAMVAEGLMRDSESLSSPMGISESPRKGAEFLMALPLPGKAQSVNGRIKAVDDVYSSFALTGTVGLAGSEGEPTTVAQPSLKAALLGHGARRP